MEILDPVDPPFDQSIVTSRIQILENIASTLDVEEVLKRIVEAAMDLTEANEGSLLLLDEQTGELYMRAAQGFGEEYARTFRQAATDDTIAGRVILTGEPVLLDPEEGSGETIKVKTDFFASSVLNLPLKREGVTHGVLAVYKSGRQAPFTAEHLELLTPLADYAAIAIKNAHRYQETEYLLTDSYNLFDIASLFTETRDLEELLDLVACLTLGRLEPADRVIVHILNEQSGRLEYKVRVPPTRKPQVVPSGFNVGEGVAGRVLLENRPLNIHDIDADPIFVSRGLTFGSMMVAPISRRSACIGTISVASREKYAFNRRNERFLTSLANLAAIAIENARLYEQQYQLYKESQDQLARVERRNRELNSLRGILGALQSTLALPKVFAKVAKGVVVGLNYRAVMLATIDEDNEWLTVRELALEPVLAASDLQKKAAAFLEQPMVGTQLPLTDPQSNLGIQVCLDGEARITDRLYDIFRPLVTEETCELLQKKFALSTIAVIPIRSKDRLYGVLYASTERVEIASSHLEALEAFANQAGLAIKNARQFEHTHERLRRRVKELQGVQDIERLISSSADLELMLDSILDMSFRLVDAECGNIALTDERDGELKPLVSHPKDSINLTYYEQSLAAWVARRRRTARVADLARTAWQSTYQGIEVRAELAVPILVGEAVVGVINVGSTKSGAFTEEDESLLNILATQAAVAIQMGRSYQELEKTRKRSTEAERIAAMSDMASNMVHNINNSVEAIRALVQQVRFKMDHEALTPEFLDKKLAAIEHSAGKTLDLARHIRNPFQTLVTEPIDINQAIRRVLKDFDPKPSTLEVVLELADDLPTVPVTQQIEEVFRNLIRNAIQSMKGLGTLHIATQQKGRILEIAVIDTGPGIDAGLTDTSVFNLGISSKNDGLGYGLWWCKIYLNRVGGTIDLEEAVSSGCRFVVNLPLAEGQKDS